MRRISSSEIIRDTYGVGQTLLGGSRTDRRLSNWLGRRIQATREELRLTKTAFAGLVGVSQPTVTRWELGYDIPDERHLQKLAAIIGVSVPELRYGHAGLSEPVPVVGYVGPGAEVVPLRPERGESELEQVTALPGLDDRNMLALRVRGGGFGPLLRERWLVFYRRPDEGVSDDCVGQVCVTCLADGRLLLRELRLAAGRADANRCFDLVSCDDRLEVLLSQSLDWASPVLGFRAP